MNKKAVIGLGLVAVLILAGYGWFFFQRYLNSGLGASGTIEVTEVVVSSKVMGRITTLNVDEGSDVKAGDVMALIETQDYQAGLDNAKAKQKLAQSDFNRAKELFASQTISPEDFDNARTNLEAATAALKLAQYQLDYTTITAPITGTILAKAIEMGELAVPGSPIVTMANLDEVKLMLYVGEKEVGKIKLGEEVKVTVDSLPGKVFMGKVSYISDKEEFTPKPIQTKEERTTYVYRIKVIIPNLGHDLKPGMPADGAFAWNSQ
ncbi:MAG: efflux RND transporter periplasmic adaptor subunit [Candidatus Margulisbacteria bacterium]|nr:efflux RND transporter periplasmic adaptor subunit [Candidatus Margulisiibacteriota bacterium]